MNLRRKLNQEYIVIMIFKREAMEMNEKFDEISSESKKAQLNTYLGQSWDKHGTKFIII